MLQYVFMQNALIISFMIAIICPAIGIFLVVRRYSMIGDTLAHSSLAGISLGLLFNQNPILGAFLFTSFCGALIEFLRKYFRKYTDLILSIVLAFSVGIALIIIGSGKLKANAESYMFGSVLTVTTQDIYTVMVLCVVAFLMIFFLYHKMIYISYDEEAARIAGVRTQVINYIFSILVATSIAATVRIVGVLVLSSMIALPVATAIQFEKGFRFTMIASIVVSVFDIMAGLILGYYLNIVPSGFTALISVMVLLMVIVGKKIVTLTRQHHG